MQTGLLHLHSFLPYLVLASWFILLVLALIGKMQGSAVSALAKTLWKIGLGLTHLQVIIGLLLFFYSPKGLAAVQAVGMGEVMKTPELRLLVVEHPMTMVLAAVLLTIGSAKFKRAKSPSQAWNRTLIFVLAGLVLMLSRIPWNQWMAA